jgi:hypothetical protein
MVGAILVAKRSANRATVVVDMTRTRFCDSGGLHVLLRAHQLAIAADAELRRRHPEQRFTPLRSAEPRPATGAQRAEITLTPGQDIPNRASG